MAKGAQPRRPDDPLDPAVARAGGDSWTGSEVPLAEETEAYEVEILDGVVVKRRLTSGTTSVTYTAAQQIADWGALLGPGHSLAIRIFQLSARVGQGAAQISTLTF